MKKISFKGLWILGLLAFACQSENKEPAAPAAEAPKPPPVKEAKSKTCRLKSMTSFKRGMKRDSVPQKVISTNTYDDKGKLIKSENDQKGPRNPGPAIYTYDDKGRLISCEHPISESNKKGIKATYVYDEQGRVKEINANTGIMPRQFEYNDKGQIVTQTTLFSAAPGGTPKPYNIATFEYDAKGAPVKVINKNTKGKVLVTWELKYEDKKNPFVGAGFGNIDELFIGYPVGNYKFFAVEKKMIGKGMKPSQLTYTYNEWGYPVTMTDASKGEHGITTLAYDCS